jgi:hypothetical protein
MDSISRNDSWELVDLPPRRKAISSKWILKLEFNLDGKTNKLNGCKQDKMNN